MKISDYTGQRPPTSRAHLDALEARVKSAAMAPTLADLERQALDAMHAASLPFDALELDAGFRRKRGADHLWYAADTGQHRDGTPWLSVTAGDAKRTGDVSTPVIVWHSWQALPLSADDHQHVEAQLKAARMTRAATLDAERAQARKVAGELWSAGTDYVNGHAYLQAKQVPAIGIRRMDDALLVPLRDHAGELHGLQVIEAAGTKRFNTGAAVAGHYHLLGTPSPAGGPLYIAEGYATAATVHQATGAPCAVAFNAGNLKPVAEVLRQLYPAARIMIAADDDHATEGNPGLRHAAAAAAAVGGQVLAPTFPAGSERGTDWNDLLASCGIEAVRERLGSAAAAERPRTRPAPVYFDAIEPRITTHYLVKGVVPADAHTLVMGPPKSGKSFFTTDLALRIAAGLDWRDRRVRRAPVVYLAAEAPVSVINRVTAWRNHHQVTEAAFALCPWSLSLLRPDDVQAFLGFCREVQEHYSEPVGLIVVDTLARVFAGGDENSAADMGTFVAALDRLRAELGASTLTVHHTGKDASKGGRGSNSLEAAVDIVILIENRVAKLELCRDAQAGTTWPFELEVVELGQDEDGDAVTTCVAIPADAQAATTDNRHRGLSPQQGAAMTLLHRLLDRQEHRHPAGHDDIASGARPGQWKVLVEDWRAQVYQADVSGASTDTLKKRFQRIVEGLTERHVVTIRGGFAWLS